MRNIILSREIESDDFPFVAEWTAMAQDGSLWRDATAQNPQIAVERAVRKRAMAVADCDDNGSVQ